MKILIDIPEDTHERITRPDRLFTDDDVNKICWAVYNGIPIPDNVPTVDVLDKIRAEIDVARFIDKDTKLCKNANASGLEVAMQIIDKYR